MKPSGRPPEPGNDGAVVDFPLATVSITTSSILTWSTAYVVVDVAKVAAVSVCS
jgi:hypothetical protein